MKSIYITTALSIFNNLTMAYENEFHSYGVADVSAATADVNSHVQDLRGEYEAINNNASRVGIFGKLQKNDEYSVIYRMEYGINLTSDRKKETVFLRELYTGVEGNVGVAKVGFINTPFKLSQANVDVFSDVIDMSNLISGENVEDMINITTKRFYGSSLNAAYVITDRSDDENLLARNGHSLSLSYQGSLLYIAVSHNDYGRSGEIIRLVTQYKTKRALAGLLFQSQEPTDASDGNHEGLVASFSYAIGNYQLKTRVIRSNIEEGVKDFYGLTREKTTSLSLGIDYHTTDRSKIYAYTSTARTRSGNDVRDSGLGVRIDF